MTPLASFAGQGAAPAGPAEVERPFAAVSPAGQDDTTPDAPAREHVEGGTPAESDRTSAEGDGTDDLKSEMERLLDQLVSATRAQK